MKIFRALAAILVAALALYGFGRFFLSQLGAGRALEPPGVIQAAPPDFHVVERGELSAAEAADALATLLLARPPGGKVGVKFQRAGSVVYWLADTRPDHLEESAASAAGTRVQTVWRGHIPERLQWARAHGDPAAPGLPPPEKRNLYH